MKTTVLRDYQLKAAEKLHNGYAKKLHRLGVMLPCGLGKTVIMAYISAMTWKNGGRVNIILPLDTLFDQTIKKLLAAGIDPDDIGVVKARRNEVHKRVLVVSVHSLRSTERMAQLPIPQLTVVDEAHVSVSPIYRKLYEHLGPDAYLSGFTATWMRSDNNGLGDVWEEIVFKRTIGWAVDKGLLVPPRGIQLGGQLDLTGVRTTATGDYSDNGLEQVVMIKDLRDTVISGYHKVTPGRSAVLFAPTQVSARFFGDALRKGIPEKGIPGVLVAEIFATTKPAMRRWALDGFERGAVQVLITCTALAIGWDSPRCDTALMVRPTKHAGLFIQQVGRILRPWPLKKEAFVLDFVGLLDDKNLNAAIDLRTTPEREEHDPDLEECDECGEYRILRYISRVEQNLCSACIKILDIEPEQREHTVRKITGITEIDILASSTARWLQTDFGMPFIMTSDKAQCGRGRIFFLAHINGLYNAGVTHSAKIFKGGAWLAEGVEAEEATDAASNAALEDDPTIVHRGAAWRQKPQAPSTGQLSYAADLGIDTAGMNMAQVADAITVKVASRTLGSVYRKMYLDMREMEPAV